MILATTIVITIWTPSTAYRKNKLFNSAVLTSATRSINPIFKTHQHFKQEYGG